MTTFRGLPIVKAYERSSIYISTALRRYSAIVAQYEPCSNVQGKHARSISYKLKNLHSKQNITSEFPSRCIKHHSQTTRSAPTEVTVTKMKITIQLAFRGDDVIQHIYV